MRSGPAPPVRSTSTSSPASPNRRRSTWSARPASRWRPSTGDTRSGRGSTSCTRPASGSSNRSGRSTTARQAVDDGVDVVVAQGQEAGGHNYATLPTFALVPLVVDAVAPALVLASGGDRRRAGPGRRPDAGGGRWLGRHPAGRQYRVAGARRIQGAPGRGGWHRHRTDRHVRAGESRSSTRCACCATGWSGNGTVWTMPTDTSRLPVIGHTDLGGQVIEMHKFSFLVPMRGRYQRATSRRWLCWPARASGWWARSSRLPQ